VAISSAPHPAASKALTLSGFDNILSKPSKSAPNLKPSYLTFSVVGILIFVWIWVLSHCDTASFNPFVASGTLRAFTSSRIAANASSGFLLFIALLIALTGLSLIKKENKFKLLFFSFDISFSSFVAMSIFSAKLALTASIFFWSLSLLCSIKSFWLLNWLIVVSFSANSLDFLASPAVITSAFFSFIVVLYSSICLAMLGYFWRIGL